MIRLFLLLAVYVLVAACAAPATGSPAPTLTPQAQTSALVGSAKQLATVQSTAPSHADTQPTAVQQDGWIGMAEAVAQIRQLTATPILFPSALPDDLRPRRECSPKGGCSIVFCSPACQRRIILEVMIANPAPVGSNSVQATKPFRTVQALYGIDDQTLPRSRRWLMWDEPGNSTLAGESRQHVPYFLSTNGMTEDEFWQIANSLKDISNQH